MIFVKAPAPAAPDQQVVEIPQDGGRKTLLYVLLKKTDDSPDVKFSTPAPTTASEPEVYFIKYKADEEEKNKGEKAPKSSYGAPETPNSVYGTPTK